MEQTKELVKYHNELNYARFGNFTPTEMDIFFAIISKMRDSHGREATLSLEELRNITGYSQRGNKRLSREIMKAYQKYWNLSYSSQEDDNKVSFYHLFEKFTINYEEMTLTLQISEECLYLLDDLGVTGRYTMYELAQFCSLKSGYSKTIFRLLKQFRTTGFLTLSIEEFRKALNIPSSYRMAEITRKIINPAVEELGTYFANLKYDYVRGQGKGSPVIRINFMFTAQNKDEYKELALEQGRKTSHKCPYCGEPLYERYINGHNCWCHLDGYLEGAKCNVIFNGIDEVMWGKKSEFKNIEDEPEEFKENREMVKNLIDQLF